MGGPNIFKKLLAKSSASNLLGSKDLELAKHFRVIKKLGTGGYSTVYEVERLSDRVHYALKVTNVKELKPQVAHEVVQEIRLLASLQHPNLVQFHEAFVDHDKLCIVTELMPSGDLSTAIMLRYDRMQRFSEGAIWSMFLQIAVAVQYLHHNHIMHRDLKPQNVLVGSDGTLKLADLGIAEILDRVFTETKSGTPHYMPPEFWQYERCSYSGDVWALGCVLHELCALRPLFLCRTQRAMEDKMLSGVWERIPRRYSPQLQSVVDALLAVDPAARPTMDEVLQLPAVRAAAAAAPEPLRSRCCSSGTLADDVVPCMFAAIDAPAAASPAAAWDGLNELLPPARYASGGTSVSDTLRAARLKRRAMSTGDLRRLNAAAAAAATRATVPRRPPSAMPTVRSVALLRRKSTESALVLRSNSSASLGSSGATGSAQDLRPESRSHSLTELDARRMLGASPVNVGSSAALRGPHLAGSWGSAGSPHGSGPRLAPGGSSGNLHGSSVHWGSVYGGSVHGGSVHGGSTHGSSHLLTGTNGSVHGGSTHGSSHLLTGTNGSVHDGQHGGVPLPPGAQRQGNAMPDLSQLLGPAAGLGGMMAPHPEALPLSSVLAAGRLHNHSNH